MADNRRGQGLYYFSRGQLVVLAGGFTVTSIIVFFLGVLIGQGIEERKLLKREEPLVKIPVQPLSRGSSQISRGQAKEEMTFYDTLAKSSPGTQPARLAQEKEVKPVRKATKPAVKETKAILQEAKGPVEEKVKEGVSAEKTASLLETKKEAQAQKAAEAVKTTGAGERPWTVQVNAFPDEKRAQNLVERLKDKGYDAYMVETSIKGKTWYRVRVGRFPTREEAKGLQESLQTKEKFTKAITVSR